ncbi:hypothetical protein VTN96DRAFT_6751 [Rasamsonia emersonii]
MSATKVQKDILMTQQEAVIPRFSTGTILLRTLEASLGLSRLWCKRDLPPRKAAQDLFPAKPLGCWANQISIVLMIPRGKRQGWSKCLASPLELVTSGNGKFLLLAWPY